MRRIRVSRLTAQTGLSWQLIRVRPTAYNGTGDGTLGADQGAARGGGRRERVIEHLLVRGTRRAVA